MSAAGISAAPAKAHQFETAFRPETPDDVKIVNSAFLRGLRGSPYSFGAAEDEFFAVGRRALDGMRRDMQITLAHVPSQPDEVQGFVIHGMTATRNPDDSLPLIGWVYVARPWQGDGIGVRLLARAGVLPRRKFSVLFAAPGPIRKYKAMNYEPLFSPFACWRWLAPKEFEGNA